MEVQVAVLVAVVEKKGLVERPEMKEVALRYPMLK